MAGEPARGGFGEGQVTGRISDRLDREGASATPAGVGRAVHWPDECGAGLKRTWLGMAKVFGLALAAAERPWIEQKFIRNLEALSRLRKVDENYQHQAGGEAGQEAVFTGVERSPPPG